MTSDGYLPGAECLLHSLRQSGTRRVLVTLVTRAVTPQARAVLAKRCDKVIEVEAVANPHARDPGQAGKCWADAGYTKLQVWGLHESYDRVVYVDVDAVVRVNIDDLFALDVELAAAPDVFPPDKFNAGVLVVRPDATMHERLLGLAPTSPSYDGGDTGFLNHCFPGWFAGEQGLGRLPFAYNAQRTMHWMTRATPGYVRAPRPVRGLRSTACARTASVPRSGGASSPSACCTSRRPPSPGRRRTARATWRWSGGRCSWGRRSRGSGSSAPRAGPSAGFRCKGAVCVRVRVSRGPNRV